MTSRAWFIVGSAFVLAIGAVGARQGYLAGQKPSEPMAARSESNSPETPACCTDGPNLRATLLAKASAPASPGVAEVVTDVAGSILGAGQPLGKRQDVPLFGGTPARNMVNLVAKNVPTDWNVEEKKNIRWSADLGNKCYGGPVVAGGVVFVGTNNANPRDPAVKGHKAVLMAFDEASGKFLYQTVHDIPNTPIFQEGIGQGLCSTPSIEGDRVYYVTPGCEVVSVDATNGKVLWTYGMMKELKVVPFHLSNCSPVVVGDQVLVITGNGVDNQGTLVSPEAPSFIAVNKKTGKLTWQNNMPGAAVIEGQWSNPAVAKIRGQDVAIFAGGDCVLYGLLPDTGRMIFKIKCNPKPPEEGGRETAPYIVSTPVVVGDRIYVGLGVYPEHPSAPRSSHFLCFDATKQGDASPKSYDLKDPANSKSALVWAFGGPIEPRPKRGRPAYFGRTISTAAVHDGLVYIAEETGYLHCLDAATGKRHWEYDFKSPVWGSPYWVDGKVYVGTEDGEMVIFEHGRTQKVLAKIDMGDGMHSTPIVANGTLFVATKSRLFAIGAR